MNWSDAATSAPRLLWSCPRPEFCLLFLELLVKSLRVPKRLKNWLLSRFHDGSDSLNLRLILLDHIQDVLFYIRARLLYFLKLGFMTGHLRSELIVILLANFKHTSTSTGCCKTCILSFLEFCKLFCVNFRLGTIECWNCHSPSVSYCSFDFVVLSSCWALARSPLRLGSIRDTFLLDWTVVIEI